MLGFFTTIHLMGCTTGTKIYIDTTADKQSQQLMEKKLSEAATSIDKSLTQLAQIEHSLHPPKPILSPVDPDMIGMGQLAALDWNGPVGPLVQKIATISKYKLNILGTPPGIPILVSILAKDTPLSDILRDASFQCSKKANIVVYPASRIIELRYTKS